MDQLPEDVELAILTWANRQSSLNLSLVSKRWRIVCLPEVFRKVTIFGTWAVAEPRVTLFLKSRELCSFVQQFDMIIYVKGDDRRGLAWIFSPNKGDRMVPKRDFPSTLVKLLTNMTGLRLLRFSIPAENVQLFNDAFSKASLRLQSVRGLSLGISNYFLVPYCPELQAVSIDAESRWRRTNVKSDPCSFIRSFAGRPIQFFSMWDWWTTETTSAILEAMPDLKTLQMGHFGSQLRLHEHLMILKNLKSLEQFEFVSMWHVDLNVSGDLRAESTQNQLKESILGTCPGIQRFNIQVPLVMDVSYGGCLITDIETASMVRPRMCRVDTKDKSSPSV
ncbi:hypothetical protein BD410DRAFT_620240 [Rickenella mellea]|uniref:F-box domain-containing protein n=1 Tax=Rickenella mellea TaxID=50990 RepID=A0A4Y7PMT3_9AGAM|nr:hypothetical protein BD410DRAFT_620240 [Rickenella mellea]